MRNAAFTSLLIVVLLVAGHVLAVVRDGLFELWLRPKATTDADSLRQDMLSPRHLLVGMVAFAATYLVGLTLNDKARMSYAGVVGVALLVGAGSWVAARIAFRRKATADSAVPLWSAAPLAVVVGGIFAWSGVA